MATAKHSGQGRISAHKRQHEEPPPQIQEELKENIHSTPTNQRQMNVTPNEDGYENFGEDEENNQSSVSDLPHPTTAVKPNKKEIVKRITSNYKRNIVFGTPPPEQVLEEHQQNPILVNEDSLHFVQAAATLQPTMQNSRRGSASRKWRNKSKIQFCKQRSHQSQIKKSKIESNLAKSTINGDDMFP